MFYSMTLDTIVFNAPEILSHKTNVYHAVKQKRYHGKKWNSNNQGFGPKASIFKKNRNLLWKPSSVLVSAPRSTGMSKNNQLKTL